MRYVITSLLLLPLFSALSNPCIDSALSEFKKLNYEETIEILKDCEETIKKTDNSKILTKYYYGLGRTYLELKNLDSALKYQLIAYGLKNKFDYANNLNLTYNDLGRVYLGKGLIHKSIYNFKRAVDLNLKKDKLNLLSINYNNIGVAYEGINEKDSSLKYYTLALKYIEYDNENTKPLIYNNLGVIKLYGNEIEIAQEYFKKALHNINNITKRDSLFYKTNLSIANIYDGMKVNKSDFYNYLKETERIENNYYLFDAFYKLSLYNLSIMDQSKAFKYLKSSLDILKNNNNYIKSMEIINKYINFSNKLRMQIDNGKELTTIKNNLSSLLNSQLIAEYGREIEYKLNSEKIANRLEKEIYRSEMNFYILLTVIISFLISLLFGVSWFIKNSYFKELKLKVLRKNESAELKIHYIQNDLGKLLFMVDNTSGIKHKEQIMKTIDQAIRNSNELRRQNKLDFSNK